MQDIRKGQALTVTAIIGACSPVDPLPEPDPNGRAAQTASRFSQIMLQTPAFDYLEQRPLLLGKGGPNPLPMI